LEKKDEVGLRSNKIKLLLNRMSHLVPLCCFGRFSWEWILEFAIVFTSR